MKRLFLFGICWCCISITPFLYPAQAQTRYQFENISSDQGLSNGTINAILQDKNGFMYFGTNQGLNRFDGYKFKVFLPESGNAHALSNNNVRALLEDSSGAIWVGTDGGLNKYDPLTETFRPYKTFTDSLGISSQIMDIAEDQAGNIWLATMTYQTRKGGLVLFEKSKNKFQKLYNEITKDIEVDEFGNLWISGPDGIIIFNPATKKVVRHIRAEKQPSASLVSDNVIKLFREKNGIMWATTGSNAITKIKYDKDLHLSFENFKDLIKEKKENAVSSMMKDSKGNFWISTFEGIVVFNEGTGNKLTLRTTNDNIYSLKENGVNTVFEDRSQTIWIGHGTIGISKVKNNKGFYVLGHSSNDPESLAGNNVMAMCADHNGSLWANIVDGGIHRIDFDGNYSSYPRIKRYEVPNRIINAIACDREGKIWAGSELYIATLEADKFQILSNNQWIYALLVDHQNNLWGTSSRRVFKIIKKNGGGLDYSISLPDSSLNSKFQLVNFNEMFEDANKRVWTTNWQGEIFYYDTLRNKFFAPKLNMAADTTFKDSRISTFMVDSKGFFWAATLEGLGKYKIQTTGGGIELVLQKVYREKEGLMTKDKKSNLYTAAITEDHHGNIWLAQVGLSVLNPETDEIRKFDLQDGLPSNTFAYHSSSKLPKGYLAFGTTNGICIFHPDSVRDNVVAPQIVLTDFQILHQSVPIKNKYRASDDNQFTLSQSIIHTKEITITYDMNVLGFEFAAMDFKTPHRNQFSYQMVGFDNDWVYAGSKNTATYTNLEPGSYTFRVKGSNNDGTWNEVGTSITINVLPPPWRTWWAYGLYSIGFVLILLAGRNEIIKREQLKTTAKLKEAEAQKYHELDTLKSRFFSNISHEFRTPLTLLLGPIEKRLNNATSDGERKELSIMHSNANRLLTLVNQLLDLSRLESGSLKLKCQWRNLNEFITSVSSQFSSMADSRDIRFTIDAHQNIELYFDSEKLEKILTNLLSNAFKFTPEKGSITVSISTNESNGNFENGFAAIVVKDSGIGIEPRDLPRIFDRFYQVDSSATRQYEGSGIGLALVKELVELHHGTISVTSTPGEGTIFTIQLPMGKDHLSEKEIAGESDEIKSISVTPAAEEVFDGQESEDNVLLPKILVVEDNADLRHYLRSCLSNKYSISESNDGAEGFSKAIEEVPDLIISDLMMPVMDGIQLAKKLKENEKTSHIPVILLTAKADSSTKLEGLKTGADDYITKPFSQDELETRVNNLITIRKTLQKKYSGQLNLKPSDIKVDSMEDLFLKKVITLIEEHLDDTSFGVEVLSQEAAMSTTQLYRKLKSITGFTPNEVIRNTRLKRAASLLRQRAGNVGDIAYQVGFNNLSYFSKCFKEKFGVTPSEYTLQKSDPT